MILMVHLQLTRLDIDCLPCNSDARAESRAEEYPSVKPCQSATVWGPFIYYVRFKHGFVLYFLASLLGWMGRKWLSHFLFERL
jgi:hypothetical protein